MGRRSAYDGPARSEASSESGKHDGRGNQANVRMANCWPRCQTSDDLSVAYGWDYSELAKRTFKKKTGLDAPVPPELAKLREQFRTIDAIDRPKGVVPDADPWLQWSNFATKDIVGGYNRALTETCVKTVPSLKLGPVPAPMQLPLWSPGQYPPHSFGADGFNLLNYYYYLCYWQPEIGNLYWDEIARLNNRDMELWTEPDCCYQDEPTYNRNTFFLHAAGGCQGIVYYSYTEAAPNASRKNWGVLDARSCGRSIRCLANCGQFSPRLDSCCPTRSLPTDRSMPSTRFTPMRTCWPRISTRNQRARKKYFPDLPGVIKHSYFGTCSGCASRSSGHWRTTLPMVAWFWWMRRRPRRFTAPSNCRSILQWARHGPAARAIRGSAVPASRTTYTSTVSLRFKVRMGNYVKPWADCSDPTLIVRRHGYRGVPYLWLVNIHDRMEYEYLRARVGAGARPENPERAKKEAFDFLARVADKRFHAKVTIPDGNSAAYDVLTGKRLPLEKSGDRVTFTADMERLGGTLVALYPEPIAGVRVELLDGRTIRRGQDALLKVLVLGPSGRPIAGTQPLSVTIMAPQGEWAEITGAHATEDGVWTTTIRPAVNDGSGTWKIQVRELSSGVVAETAFEVR